MILCLDFIKHFLFLYLFFFLGGGFVGFWWCFFWGCVCLAVCLFVSLLFVLFVFCLDISNKNLNTNLIFVSTEMATPNIEMSDINVETGNGDPLHGYVNNVLLLSLPYNIKRNYRVKR